MKNEYRQTGAYSAVLPVDFPSLCPSSETPSASAPPRLKDTCDGSPSAGKGEGERSERRERRRGEKMKEGKKERGEDEGGGRGGNGEA